MLQMQVLNIIVILDILLSDCYCDVIRSRNKVGSETFLSALKQLTETMR